MIHSVEISRRQIHIVPFRTSYRLVKHDGFPSISSIVPCHSRTDYKCTHKLQTNERQRFMSSTHLHTNKRLSYDEHSTIHFSSNTKALHHLTTSSTLYPSHSRAFSRSQILPLFIAEKIVVKYSPNHFLGK